jgi:hypothetical protein
VHHHESLAAKVGRRAHDDDVAKKPIRFAIVAIEVRGIDLSCSSRFAHPAKRLSNPRKQLDKDAAMEGYMVIWLSGPDLCENVGVFRHFKIRFLAAFSYFSFTLETDQIDPVLRTVTTVSFPPIKSITCEITLRDRVRFNNVQVLTWKVGIQLLFLIFSELPCHK